MSTVFKLEEITALEIDFERIDELVMEIDENPDIIYEDSFPQILCILEGHVLDLRKFISKHPGGPHAILQYTGKDVSQVFNSIHSGRAKVATRQYIVGTVSL